MPGQYQEVNAARHTDLATISKFFHDVDAGHDPDGVHGVGGGVDGVHVGGGGGGGPPALAEKGDADEAEAMLAASAPGAVSAAGLQQRRPAAAAQ
jgi:hypothetical protein